MDSRLVELHGPQRDDLPGRGRGVPDLDPRTGAGFAASFAKIGAVLTAFLFPILLKDIGADLLLLILVGTSLLGALVTWLYAIETRGVSLEEIRDKMVDPA